jgi:hypothetical protein
MRCTHCGDALRRDGLVLVAETDDSTACPDAPMRRCGHCSGDGCGSCEGYGGIYGRPVAQPERPTSEQYNSRTDGGAR